MVGSPIRLSYRGSIETRVVERSGFSVYFSTDLRQKVSDWADNSTSSQADILDKALEDFFDSHEISEDGTIVSKDANRRADGANVANVGDGGLEEVIENQEEMLELLRGGHGASAEDPADIISEPDEESSDGESNVPATTGASDVEEQIASLAGEYNHDECIDPDDVAALDVSGSTVVKQKPDHLIPAVVGMINRDQMSRQGVLHPHPSIDDEIVGEEMEKAVKTKAAKESDRWVNSYEDIDDPDRFADDVADYITEYVSDWEREQKHLGEYCVDEEEYVDELWRIVREAAETMAHKKPNTRSGRGEMSDAERLRGASRVVAALVGCLGDRTEGWRVDDVDEYREWTLEWADNREDVRETLYGVDDGEDLDENEAREVLGVGEDATDEEILEAYEAYVMDHHPDAGGSDEEIDVDEFHGVLKAKRVLTA